MRRRLICFCAANAAKYLNAAPATVRRLQAGGRAPSVPAQWPSGGCATGPWGLFSSLGPDEGSRESRHNFRWMTKAFIRALGAHVVLHANRALNNAVARLLSTALAPAHACMRRQPIALRRRPATLNGNASQEAWVQFSILPPSLIRLKICTDARILMKVKFRTRRRQSLHFALCASV
jgi:hypothetical protein